MSVVIVDNIAGTESSATELQGVPISSTAPNDGQVLTYDSGDAQWEPADASGTISGDNNSVVFLDNTGAATADDNQLRWDGTELTVSGTVVIGDDSATGLPAPLTAWAAPSSRVMAFGSSSGGSHGAVEVKTFPTYGEIQGSLSAGGNVQTLKINNEGGDLYLGNNLSATIFIDGATQFGSTVRVPNNVAIHGRNAANDGNVNLIKADSSDDIQIGSVTGDVISDVKIDTTESNTAADSGNFILTTGDNSSTGISGYVGIYTGAASTGFQTGPIDSSTGELSGGTGDSGYVLWQTGAKSGGASGNSGFITLATGAHAATAGSSGLISLGTGNSSTADSGDILLSVGTAAGTRGDITLDAMNVNIESETSINVEGPTLVVLATDGRVDVTPAAGGASPQLKLWNDDETFGVSFEASTSLAANLELILPLTDAAGPMVSDGSGQLSFEAGASGSFTTVDAKTVTVVNGVITSIV